MCYRGHRDFGGEARKMCREIDNEIKKNKSNPSLPRYPQDQRGV